MPATAILRGAAAALLLSLVSISGAAAGHRDGHGAVYRGPVARMHAGPHRGGMIQPGLHRRHYGYGATGYGRGYRRFDAARHHARGPSSRGRDTVTVTMARGFTAAATASGKGICRADASSPERLMASATAGGTAMAPPTPPTRPQPMAPSPAPRPTDRSTIGRSATATEGQSSPPPARRLRRLRSGRAARQSCGRSCRRLPPR